MTNNNNNNNPWMTGQGNTMGKPGNNREPLDPGFGMNNPWMGGQGNAGGGIGETMSWKIHDGPPPPGSTHIDLNKLPGGKGKEVMEDLFIEMGLNNPAQAMMSYLMDQIQNGFPVLDDLVEWLDANHEGTSTEWTMSKVHDVKVAYSLYSFS